ncbi:NAD(P)/FAD-dependent oxidoreductase [Arsenicibacter rosenii]|uniref:FAD dependent oxidoreductase domain-containing protein n=1 Tax=Arsenicibacter rosenii TaxID=1750698 RepID=A0A1S2VJF5_9BACT|nr:FAD-dependent oxidoreductase [Arsenicibacter rosenii]OIN57958.1 hypothetical protein BLX24_17870 [Arsenicibacter rosenii]
MNVRSAQTYWLENQSVPNAARTTPILQPHTSCDVLIMGGGITGALVAYELHRAGIDTVLIDKRTLGRGSTAASTALIQYEIDVPLHQLIQQVGEQDAVLAYKLCLWAIYKLRDIVGRLDTRCGFNQKHSLYYAAKADDIDMLREEYEARAKYGFQVAWLDRQAIKAQFGFDAPGGILSQEAAELDAMDLTQALYRYLIDRGLRVFEETTAEEIDYGFKRARIRTNHDTEIFARKIVYATGYETQQMMQRDQAAYADALKLKSTYALVTEPLANMPEALRRSLIWDTDEPYFYARTARDNRLMLGGEDEWVVDAAERDAMIPQKQEKLLKKINELFPDVEAKPHLTWAGTFAETQDGLPYIGEHERYPHSYFALGFGGNGITFSITAANIIRNLFQNGDCNYGGMFRFGR